MWYEIIPSFALVAGFLMIPPVAMSGVNYFLLNKKFCARKWTEHPQDFHVYLRDRRLTGSEYKPQGLEAIPNGSQ